MSGEPRDPELNGWLSVLIAFLAIAVIVGIGVTAYQAIQERGCVPMIVLVLSVLTWVPLGGMK